MGLAYKNLTDDVRANMVAEIDADIASSRISISAWLNPQVVQRWPALIREAAASKTDDWLAAKLAEQRCLKA